MKKVKVFVALLAIVAGMSSFITRPRTTGMQWFSYLGGTLSVNTNYHLIPSGDPGCSGRDFLCAIRIKSASNNLPDPIALINLITESCFFTQYGDFKDGTVELMILR